MNDLYKDGNIVPFEVWKSRGVSNCEYMLWRGLLKSIPKEWTEMLKGDQAIDDKMKLGLVVYGDNSTNIQNVSEKDVKKYYKHMAYTKLRAQDLKARAKYTMLFQVEEDLWSDIYVLPFDIIYDHKIMDMQYRILHRYIGTNKLLYIWTTVRRWDQ